MGDNMRTLKDVRDEEEEKKDGAPQEWYTGGASSGQNVIDPTRRDREDDASVPTDGRYGNMFREALRHGARHRREDIEDEQTRGQNAAASVFFSGKGRKMTDGDPREEDEDELDGDIVEEDDEETREIQRTVTFYNNGFTVDDGPLRDPAQNQEFMEMIGRGMCPPELMHPGASAKNPVKIDLKREMRDWEAPKGVKAFSGSGNKLEGAEGEGNDEGVGGGGDGGGKALEEMKPWSVDEKEPTTSIQIRLRDGSRLVAKFNLSHTVAHIRDFIRQANGEASATRPLQLSGFPPEKLDDDSRTIGNGLKGCVVQQK